MGENKMHVDTLRNLRNYSDIVHGTIIYNGFEELVLSTPLLLRLQRISQSSLAFLTFPSNKVKRFEHSIGVMHLTSRFFRGALINTNKTVLSDFFQSVKKDLDKWISTIKRNKTEYQSAYDSKLFGSNGIVILKKFTILGKGLLDDNRFFNMQIPSNIDDEHYIVCAALFQGLRLAGLLHDLGHLPYSHTLECILKRLFLDISSQESKTDLEKKYIELAEKYCESGKALHEELSEVMLDVVEHEVAQSIRNLEFDNDQQKVYALLSLVSFEIARRILYNKNSNLYKSLHCIISGVVDADRLDYASRDLLCSAVSKDVINYDRLFMHCSIHKCIDSEGLYSIVFDVKATNDVEDFLRRRWRIYRVINYHHSVLKSEVIMRRVLREKALQTLTNSPEVFYNTSTNCIVSRYFDSLPNDFIFGIMLVLHHLAEDGDEDALRKILLMLDDSWLDTLMKRSDGSNGFDNELIYGRKIYKTVLKRYSDFLDFDEMVYKSFVNKLDFFKDKAEAAQNNHFSCIEPAQQNRLVDSIEEFFEDIEDLEGYDHFVISYGSLFSNTLLRILELIFPIEESTRNNRPIELFEGFLISNNNDNERAFLGIVDFGTGIPNDDEYKLWNSKKGIFVGLTKYSSIKTDLECEKNLVPPFYLYAKVDEQETTLLNQVCEKFVSFVSDYIIDYLEKCAEDTA